MHTVNNLIRLHPGRSLRFEYISDATVFYVVIPMFHGHISGLNAFNPFMPSGLFYYNSLDRFISNRRSVWLVLMITIFVEFLVFNSKSVEPNQTPRSAASDLYLHCLPMSLLWDARIKWFI